MCETESCDRCKEIESVVEALAEFVWKTHIQSCCEHRVDGHCNEDDDFVSECSLNSCHYRKFDICQNLLYPY